MRYLTFAEVIELHRSIMAASGGAEGIRDLAALESALAQPTMGTGTAELYPGLIEKAAALCFSLVSNHPFRDGNKRVGHAAMETFLVLNGFEMAAPVRNKKKSYSPWLLVVLIERNFSSGFQITLSREPSPIVACSLTTR